MKLDEQKVLNEISQAISAIRDRVESQEKNNVSYEAKISEQKELIEKACRKIDELEVGLKKQASYLTGGKVVSEEHKAHLRWLRTGEVSDILKKATIESKMLIGGDPVTGGYLSTPEMATQIIKKVTEYSPIREVATVITIGSESYRAPTRSGKISGGRTGETETRVKTGGLAFGLETIPTHEYYAMDDISRWNLEDADFDVEGELVSSFGETLGELEGEDFVKGSGVKRPEGFMTHAGVEFVVSGHASQLTADGLFALYFKPKSAYVPRAVFVMNRATMLAASVLKDGQNNYLLRRLGDSPAWSILGARVVECPDMPGIGSNAFPVAFGDFARGYYIVDRTGLVNLRDPFTQAATGCVRFWLFKRTGGQVVLPEAICKLKIST